MGIEVSLDLRMFKLVKKYCIEMHDEFTEAAKWH